ncbi:MAG: lysophospholipid acyltransferase family protein [Microthrixaceae bacterium]
MRTPRPGPDRERDLADVADAAARAAGRAVGAPLRWARGAGFPWTAAPTPTGVEPVVEPDRLGDRYDTEWARRPVARWTRLAALETAGRAVTGTLCRPEVRNLDRLEDLDGRAVFVANHHSHLDTTLLLTALPRPWRHEMVVAAAADYFFDSRPKAALAAWAYGAVPMERQRVSRRSADTSARLLDDGWSLLVFPEGGRSPDGWGQPHKGGAAYLAVRCGVPVVPVHLDGTGRVLPKGATVPRPGTVVVNIGTPLRPAEGEDARRFAVRVDAAVAELADETVSDWWSARRRAHDGTTPSLRGPADLAEGTASWRRDWASPDRRPRLRDRSRSDRPWGLGRTR